MLREELSPNTFELEELFRELLAPTAMKRARTLREELLQRDENMEGLEKAVRLVCELGGAL